MLISTSLRGATRGGKGLCALRAAHRAENGRWNGRRRAWGHSVATLPPSSKPSTPASASHSRSSRVDVPTTTLRIVSSNRHATDVLAAYFASASGLARGDCFLLFGPVGAGKSHFSRAFIRYAMEDDEMEVPSPTYLLHNSYQRGDEVSTIHHYDLYRLGDSREGEYARLDLQDSFTNGVSLIEWPERLLEMGQVPVERVEMRISLGDVLGDCHGVDGGDGARDERQGITNAKDDPDVDEDMHDDGEGLDDDGGAAPHRHIELRAYGERFVAMVKTLGSHIEANGAKLGLRAASTSE